MMSDRKILAWMRTNLDVEASKYLARANRWPYGDTRQELLAAMFGRTFALQPRDRIRVETFAAQVWAEYDAAVDSTGNYSAILSSSGLK